MSWLYSQALVAAFSAGTCSAGEPSAQSSGTPTPQAYCVPDRMTAFSRPSRFGMTFGPLTDDRGAELLTWFLAGFHARTSALPGKAMDSTASDPACGPKWRGSLARYDHDSRSWKTAQHSLLGGSDEFSETWPRWGTTVAGELYLLPTLVRPIGENESGLWPTPTVCGNYNRKGASSTSGDGLSTAVKYWPTPTAQDAKNNGPPSQMDRNTKPLNAEVGGALNPTWVEWLMGWPLGWTDLQPSATDKYRSAPPTPGDCSPNIAA